MLAANRFSNYEQIIWSDAVVAPAVQKALGKTTGGKRWCFLSRKQSQKWTNAVLLQI